MYYKASALHQFAEFTIFTTSALVLKFSAFLKAIFGILQSLTAIAILSCTEMYNVFFPFCKNDETTGKENAAVLDLKQTL